jgi:hypothetical protein
MSQLVPNYSSGNDQGDARWITGRAELRHGGCDGAKSLEKQGFVPENGRLVPNHR